MVLAVEHIRRMRGGAQSHLMRCDDGGYYVVKFQNNPQHVRVLANEMLGTKIAGYLGLRVPQIEVVEVPRELIELTAELVIQLGTGRTPCRAGKQFGSRYPGDPAQMHVFDFLPDEQLNQVENLADFAGTLVFDKWTCNTNGRQAIFFLEPGRSHYQAMIIDQGFCFNAGEWNFPDAPLRGLYNRHSVYRHVTGMDSFEPWLTRVEERLNGSQLGEVAAGIPPEWYNHEYAKLEELIRRLDQRRRGVRELIVASRDSGRQPFPHWK
jgi:HipA-like protein